MRNFWCVVFTVIVYVLSCTSQETNYIDNYWSYIEEDYAYLHDNNKKILGFKFNELKYDNYSILVKARTLKYLFLISYYGLLAIIKDELDVSSTTLRDKLIDIKGKVELFMNKNYGPMEILKQVDNLFAVYMTPSTFCLKFFNIMSREVSNWFPEHLHYNATYKTLTTEYDWSIYKNIGDSVVMNNTLMYPPRKEQPLHELWTIIDNLKLFLLNEYKCFDYSEFDNLL
ncbi:uncharacterized protein LOC126895851 [Daktulosphaira vitifoliae]|uniref:uncharacterized protein LOC126895851 n=1 Tax=Daktulosphaira vitifoliae TaxID=58002 RepID=UPI0021A97BF1|nr:uncharacterized protein LOC126895851 [Daktulosphaira vitifoliae]